MCLCMTHVQIIPVVRDLCIRRYTICGDNSNLILLLLLLDVKSVGKIPVTGNTRYL